MIDLPRFIISLSVCQETLLPGGVGIILDERSLESRTVMKQVTQVVKGEWRFFVFVFLDLFFLSFSCYGFHPFYSFLGCLNVISVSLHVFFESVIILGHSGSGV